VGVENEAEHQLAAGIYQFDVQGWLTFKVQSLKFKVNSKNRVLLAVTRILPEKFESFPVFFVETNVRHADLLRQFPVGMVNASVVLRRKES
jgi:hypothetical protein